MVAFALGLAINQACAGSLDTMSDSELRSLVANLQEEVKALKEEVAELKNKISSSGISSQSSGFDVDQLHFNNQGVVEMKSKHHSVESKMVYSTGDIASDNSYEYDCEYDSYGRLSGYEYNPNIDSRIEVKYTYSGNAVTITQISSSSTFTSTTKATTTY